MIRLKKRIILMDDRAELLEKCKNLGKTDFGSIISKYSGKTINVEKEPNSPVEKERKN